MASESWDLPTLPTVATTILERVRDPEATAHDVGEIVSRDPALTSKILRMANSALFGLRQPVSSIHRAIVVMGFTTIRSLVMAAATQSLWRSGDAKLKDRLMWEHSLATALAARLLAEEIRHGPAEEAFVAGLVHDIGKLVMDRSLGPEYENVLERVYNESWTFIDAEQEAFGFDHAEVGALVADEWNLPEELREAVRLHHRPTEAETAPEFCAIVSLANGLCVKLGIGPEKRPALDLAALDSTAMLDVDSGTLERLGGEVRGRLDEERELLEGV